MTIAADLAARAAALATTPRFALYTTAGTTTWVCPDGVTCAKVTVKGGGAGGAASGTNGAGGGGAAGMVLIEY